MRTWMVFFVACAVLFSQNAAAEYYRVVQKDGTIRYTDNFGDVPPDQRQAVQEYDEPEDYIDEAEIEARKQKEREARIKAIKGAETAKKQETIDLLEKVKKADSKAMDPRIILSLYKLQEGKATEALELAEEARL